MSTLATKEIAQRIRHARESLGLTQAALTEKIGFKRGFVWKIESGSRGLSLEALTKVSAALKVSMDYLVHGPKIRHYRNLGHIDFYERDLYVLSNFSSHMVVYGGVTYQTSEHAYHCQRFFGQPAIQAEIRSTTSAHDAFRLAQSKRHWQDPDWNDRKRKTMRSILFAKADQHEYVRRKLLGTGSQQLVEGSWRDSYWGIGESEDGDNWMGKLWMEVREELRKGQPHDKLDQAK